MHERAAAFKQQAAESFGIEVDVHEFPAGTKTAEDAAEVVGCDLAQIASALVFVADQVVVAVTSGANNVDTRKLATRRGVHQARMAEPDEVSETLGWSIGGVPPFCHDTEVPVFLDESLTAYDTVWAAAGTPEAVFPIHPDRIVEHADAEVADIAE
jgi:prolyl-tRNA editing enzyme YbaK/EbsC (Cys-tRNA(Pro) deacylase)